MMADATNNSSNSSCNSTTSGSGGSGEPIPQWKKELLQRRKNLAKTIGTAATQVHDSASTVAAALTTTPTTPRVGGGPSGGNPFGSLGGQKDPSVVAAPSIVAEPTTISVPSESATSPTPSASSSIDSSSCISNNNNNNGDSPASPTAATTPTSLFGAPVFVGHSPPAATNEQAAQCAVLVKSAFVGGATNTVGATSSAATRASEVPLLATPQSHSNVGPESTSCTSTSRSLSHLHSSSNNSGVSSGGPVGKYAAATSGSGISATSVSVDCELTPKRPASSGETSSNSYSSEIGGWKSKKNTSSASSNSSSPKMVAASAEEIHYEKNPRFVGPGGEGGTPVDVDPSEELKYGPGIVSKLRCRYLSLALRQSANKQRPSLNNMRRATSLNNLLDEEGEDLSEREQSIEGSKDHHHQSGQDKGYFGQMGKIGQVQSQQMNNAQPPKAKTPDEYISTFQKSVQNSYTRSGRQTEKKNEYNRYNKQRGADSLKRARSVEALVRYDHKAWERDIQKENLYSSNDSNVIILDEISCTNGTTNGSNNANNCQSVAMNKAAELITDCVTIEEKIINGREKGDPKPKRLTSFIDADERPPPDVVRQTMKIFEANANRRGRPVARTNGAAGEVAAKVASYKSIISQEKPPITHPKPPLSPKKPNIIPRTTSPKPNGTTPVPAPAPVAAVANGFKDKPALPKLDINVIRTSLETTNNLKNSATPIQTPPPANHNNNITTSTPLSVRVVESQTYRLKYDSPALSPNNTAAAAAAVVVAQHKVTSSSAATTNRPESPRACMQNNTNSTALAFVDSPSSIPTLASKLANLNIVTSTPTSTRSPTPQDQPPQAPPRHIPPPLQYATSDEEDPDDPEDQQHEYSINNSDRDDDDDDQEDDYQSDDLEPAEGDDEFDYQEVKKVSRAAMDNISKAGVTTQFRFNGQSSQQQQNKSHLPSLGGGAKLLSNKKLNIDDHRQSGSNSSSSSSSPITVPVLAATATAAPVVVVAHKPPVPLSRESLAASSNGLKPTNNNNNNSNIGSVTHNLSNVSNSVSSKVVINDSGAPAPPNVSVSSDVPPSKTVNLTAREIEKNQINLEKSEESLNQSSAGSAAVATTAAAAANSASSVVLTKASGADVATSGGDFFMAKWGGATAAQKPAAADTGVVAGNPLAGLMVPVKKKVKAPPPPIEANTMVFNFSDRKEVPDYIENDGIILRPRPRELPKPGESGFVVLGDLTLETSTDPDDSWAMGPPSPCDVEFANANIVINGKSSMRNKTTRDSKFKIQFDDSLTSTFEYPSETSLLEANGYGAAGDDTTDAAANGLKDATAILAAVAINTSSSTNGAGQQQSLASAVTGTVTTTTTADSGGGGGGGGGLTFGDNGLLSHKNNLLSSMPLGSAPFASYTPVKAAIDTNFELGVTRTPSPSSTASSTCSSSNSSNATTTAHNNNDHHHQPHQQQHHNHSNGHHHHHHHLHQQQQQQQQRINGTDGSAAGLLVLNGDIGEPESIQYLKPASDEQTVNWSQGTRVTDLLF